MIGALYVAQAACELNWNVLLKQAGSNLRKFVYIQSNKLTSNLYLSIIFVILYFLYK